MYSKFSENGNFTISGKIRIAKKFYCLTIYGKFTFYSYSQFTMFGKFTKYGLTRTDNALITF